MNGSLIRLKGLALRRLWDEDPGYRARRRCRTIVTTPFAALAGLAWGVFGAPVMGVGSSLMWGALGAFALPFFMHLEQKLLPPMAELGRRMGLGDGHMAAATGEAALVGGMIYLLTSVLGAPTVPAAGTALGVGAFYAFAMEYVFCGSAAADAVALIGGAGAATQARSDRLSHAEAMAARGDHEGAIAAYRSALDRAPGDAGAYVRLARLLVQTGAFAEALDTLRTGFQRASTSPDQEAFIVRQIHALCVGKLADPHEAVGDLEKLLERQPTGQHADWAEREIGDIEDGLYEA